MERIKKAVARAEKEREKNIPSSTSRSVNESSLDQDLNNSSELSIDYSKTKTIEVDMATRESNRLVASIPDHFLQDTYGMLRTRVLQEMEKNNWKSIAVTSPTRGSGKTLTAVNLSISIAMDHSHSALLIDADLRRPSVHKYFGCNPGAGLSDYLTEKISLEEILFNPSMERLSVLPNTISVRESAEMLGSNKWQSLINEVSARYNERIIVADIAPVLHVDDALKIAKTVDCWLMVVENGRTKREQLRQALDLLSEFPVIGTVLNKSERKVADRY
ncbi:MAG: CpsD/CapB family tyrosine-protein kinase [Pseudomonadota bacterium]|nr:CpsD/CapB family tyrosine-protein kinase [Pseudomonadota bacterium]